MNFFNKIINYFKFVFKGKEKNKLLSNIEVGDIIRAKRYTNEQEKKSIPKGHREGPYIVLGKCDKGLVCSKGSSVDPTIDIDSYFIIDAHDYNLLKETYFKLKDLRLIDDYSFIKKIDRLKSYDEEKLFKQFKIQRRNYYNEKEENIDFNISLQIGDIINNNEDNYLILDISNNKLVCVRIPKSSGNLKYKLNIKAFQNLNYTDLIYLDKNNKSLYVNTLSDDMLLYVLKKQKEYIESIKNKTITQRGSVIKIESQYYYVYGEEGQEWFAFEIFKKNNKHKESIVISNKVFYTNYKDLKINKNDKFETILIATEKEMDYIKEKRKDYSKKQKHQQPIETELFNVGDIIENKNYKNERYIITHCCKKTYDCISINKLIKGIYHPILIKKIDARLSRNQSIKGIKWLEDHKDFDMKEISNPKIIQTIVETQLDIINNNTLKEETELTSIKVCRGTVISIEKNLYYIYGEEGQEWLIFEIFESDDLAKEKIEFNNKVFYTNYKDLKINKKEKLEPVFIVAEKEMDYIKEKRKDYSKKQKHSTVTKLFNIGDIIECNYYKNQRFIIIDICKKTYECVQISKLIKGIYDPILIKKIDARLSKNNSIDGIKWLEDHKDFDMKNIYDKKIIDNIIHQQQEFINTLSSEEIEKRLIMK